MRVRWLLIAALALASLAVACDAAIPAASGIGPAASAFVGPRWTAIAIRGQAPVPGHEPAIQFTDGGVRGSGGCNGFSGGYRHDERTGAIAFDRLAMTAMGCLDPRVGQVEAAFSDVLVSADRVSLDADGRLHLTGPAGAIVLAKAVEG
jgi:heat shock protein HslJ